MTVQHSQEMKSHFESLPYIVAEKKIVSHTVLAVVNHRNTMLILAQKCPLFESVWCLCNNINTYWIVFYIMF